MGKQICDIITQSFLRDLDNGHLKPGDYLESVRQLAKRFQVSPGTAAKSIKSLVSLGYARSIPGKGTIILNNPHTPEEHRGTRENVVYFALLHGKDIGSPFHDVMDVFAGIENEATRLGLRAELTITRGQEDLKRLALTKSAGLIIANEEIVEFDIPQHTPTVYCSPHAILEGTFQVGVNFHQLGSHATKRVAKAGHSHTAFITAYNTNLTTFEAQEDGYLSALRRFDLPPLVLPWNTNANETQKVQDLLQDIKKKRSPITALIVGNDNMAEEIINHAKTINMKIPDDLSVVSFGHFKEQRYLNLSTYRYDARQMGSAAVNLLHYQKHHPAVPPLKTLISFEALDGKTLNTVNQGCDNS